MDDKSCWTWVAFLKHKSDTFAAFKEWLTFVEKQTGQQLLIFHTDNEDEFITKEWKKFLKDWGIWHETASPNTLAQNGDAKRQNWTIFDCDQTILIDAGLPLFLFAEAVNYIAYTKNCHSTSTLTNTTPYEVCLNKKPDISKLHPFSCKAYIYDHSPKCKKLSPRAYEGILIGYADTQKAYQIYIPKKRTVICTACVHFDVNTNMANSFLTAPRLRGQFQYNSLKSSFQELDDSYDNDTILEPIASSDIFIQEPASALVPNDLKNVPMFPNMFQMFLMFLLHNLIHQLTIYVNLDLLGIPTLFSRYMPMINFLFD